MGENTCHSMYMEIREQLALDSSLLTPCMSLGQISGCQAWWPVPLLSEPASQIPYRYKEILHLPKNTRTHAHTPHAHTHNQSDRLFRK